MQTRRQLLQHAVLAPLALYAPKTRAPESFEIISERDCLSQESARGFALVSAPACPVIVICGAGANAMALAPDLRKRALRGAWIVWESAPPCSEPRRCAELARTIRTVFGIQTGTPLHPGLYVEYVWPKVALTRSFLDVTPVLCTESEVVAQHGGTILAMRRRIGRGGIVFLGSMLGPNLYAEEPQAHGIVTRLLRAAAPGRLIRSSGTTFAGTSKATSANM